MEEKDSLNFNLASNVFMGRKVIGVYSEDIGFWGEFFRMIYDYAAEESIMGTDQILRKGLIAIVNRLDELAVLRDEGYIAGSVVLQLGDTVDNVGTGM